MHGQTLRRHRHHRSHRGQTLGGLAASLASIALLLAIALPTIAYQQSSSMTEGSKNNLIILGVAHALYAADHNGNQWTTTPHDLAEFGNGVNDAFSNWFLQHGGQLQGPVNGQLAIWLGWAINPVDGSFGQWLYDYNGYGMPINFDNSTGLEGFGYHRMNFVQSFNAYVDGRIYSPIFFAPGDTAVIEAIVNNDPGGSCFDAPTEFCLGSTNYTYWPSYSLSPAALFSPDIWTLPEGEFPESTNGIFQYDQAFQVPAFTQAKYPDLKTHIIEQHWIQNNSASLCNPNVPPSPGDYDGCLPYFFNASINSAPVTLFYDGHVRLLPNTEVAVADAQVGVWRRDTPWGEEGYYHEFGHPATNPNLSHHVLTDGGILGRDTLGPISAAMHVEVLREHTGRRLRNAPARSFDVAPRPFADNPAMHLQMMSND